MITHATSTYPCDPNELNLRVILKLREEFPCPMGYSGHEVGLIPSVVAVAMGACVVERHITLDRAMWGSDQAASVEPQGFERLVKYIRVTEASLGDGVKQVYESEHFLAEKTAPLPVNRAIHAKSCPPRPTWTEAPLLRTSAATRASCAWASRLRAPRRPNPAGPAGDLFQRVHPADRA